MDAVKERRLDNRKDASAIFAESNRLLQQNVQVSQEIERLAWYYILVISALIVTTYVLALTVSTAVAGIPLVFLAALSYMTNRRIKRERQQIAVRAIALDTLNKRSQ